MKHAKGKWFIEKDGKRSLVIKVKLEDNAFDEEEICKLTNFILASNDEHLLAEHAKFNNEELMQANAKLISKAPEMYEALKTIRTMSIRRDNGHFDKPDHSQEIELIESLLKEIEK